IALFPATAFVGCNPGIIANADAEPESIIATDRDAEHPQAIFTLHLGMAVRRAFAAAVLQTVVDPPLRDAWVLVCRVSRRHGGRGGDGRACHGQASARQKHTSRDHGNTPGTPGLVTYRRHIP